MHEDPTISALVAFCESDPRLSMDYLRFIPGPSGEGTILLIGVVHDHPASVYRVTSLLRRFPPEILAVELPPLALSLFRIYARDAFTPPRLGGEISAALQDVESVRTVGIDAPTLLYLRQLAHRFRTGRFPSDLIRPVLIDLVSMTIHAIACRLGGLIGSMTRMRLKLYSPMQFSCSDHDPPSVQAEHETRHLARQQAFLRAVETPRARQLIDATRDDSMAIRILDLSSQGDVTAIVGMEHLDSLNDRLNEMV